MLRNLKKLWLGFLLHIDNNMKHRLMTALESNYSLQSVDGSTRQNRWSAVTLLFDENDKHRLQLFADRNDRLAKWIENPNTIERNLWPDYLNLAEEAGPDTLLACLRALSGYELVSPQGRRKRKAEQQH